MSQGASVDDTVKKSAVKWLLGQETSTIILGAMLVAMCYGGWKCVTEVVPRHLQMINDGYKAISTIHREAVREIGERHTADQKELRDTFEKTLDRIERRPLAKANQ